jgi:hypothetical protein
MHCEIDSVIPAIVVKPPYSDKWGTFMHVAIEAEEAKVNYFSNNEDWPNSCWRRRIFEVRIPFNRVSVKK